MSADKWAEGPWELIELPSKSKDISMHGAYHVANEMALAHNCMIRGLNSLLLQSPHVKESQDATDILFFGHSWAAWVANHLRLEEELMFPGYEAVEGVPKGALAHEDEQHAAFASDLQAFQDYCGFVKGEDYSSTKFTALINAFAKPFIEHLHEEIPMLLRLDVCGEKGSAELLEVLKKGEADAARQDKFVVPPMVFGLRDQTSEGGQNWPTAPLVVEYLVNYVLSWKYSGAWRFLPSDHWGNPKAQAFGTENKDNRI